MRHIDRVGVELEGGWQRDAMDPGRCNNCDPCDGCWDGDNDECGSDNDYHRCGRCNDCEIRELPIGFKYDGSVGGLSTPFQGECISPPMNRLDHLGIWIKNHYPGDTNHTCGYHVHVSLKRVFDYSRLMNGDFYGYFLREFEAWGKAVKLNSRHQFWNRLRGDNQFCIKEHIPDRQVVGEGGRYTQLNYCWREHKTVECRIFPMFKEPKISILAMYRLVEVVESWLSAQPREKSIIASVKDRDIGTLGENNIVLPVINALDIPSPLLSTPSLGDMYEVRMNSREPRDRAIQWSDFGFVDEQPTDPNFALTRTED